MKRLIAILLAVFMIFTICACKPNGGTQGDNKPTKNPTEISWSVIPDESILGAWTPDEPISNEYIIFTQDGKLRVANGTVVIDADIQYGVDGLGNHSAYTEGKYLYGQWTYTIENGVLTITYPDESVETFKYATDYKPITLVAKEDFVSDETLLGEWSNDLYDDEYVFTEDGYAVFSQEYDDGVNVFDTEIKYTYTVSDGTLTLYYFDNYENEEKVDTMEYSIDGDKLLIDGNDYYRDGSDAIAASENAE